MTTRNVRDYSKRGDAIPVPNLTRVQQDAYTRFLQKDLVHEERKTHLGLQSLLREVFPIESYDGNMKLEFVSYSFGEPQHTESECRELRLTYGYPWRVKMRLKREDSTDVLEEDIYLGDIPILLGGGEFVVNGSERVIVDLDRLVVATP